MNWMMRPLLVCILRLTTIIFHRLPGAAPGILQGNKFEIQHKLPQWCDWFLGGSQPSPSLFVVFSVARGFQGHEKSSTFSRGSDETGRRFRFPCASMVTHFRRFSGDAAESMARGLQARELGGSRCGVLWPCGFLRVHVCCGRFLCVNVVCFLFVCVVFRLGGTPPF